MVNVQPHVRASWGGVLGNPGVEVWTNSINMMGLTGGATAGADGASLRGLLPALATIVSDWFHARGDTGRGISAISSTAQLTWVKLNFIGANGKYRDNPNTLMLATPVFGGGQTNATTPIPGTIWQQSSVISLLTGQARGRGSHGRIYPPACGLPVGNDGYMDAALTTAMQQNAVRLLGDLNKLVGAGGSGLQFNACVVSAESKGRAPINTPITRLHVDRIPDVQRRRVNRLSPNSLTDTTVFINT
jgi:hypothetical protein